MNKWRLLDTGRLTAGENIALDEVLLRSRERGESPNTIRFLQFHPPAVLVGYNQSVEQEVRVEYCREKKIDINRRITGGGAIFFDETQLGWEIICNKSFMNINIVNVDLFKRACEPVIIALEELGIQASFRPRNDIEVGGRKISGTGGIEEGEALLFQGTLLVDFDVDTMLRVLRMPIEKLKAREAASARERVTCLKWEIGYVPEAEVLKGVLKRSFQECFGINLEDGFLTSGEKVVFNERKKHFESESWINKIKLPKHEQGAVHSIRKAEGGTIRTTMVVNLRQKRIKSVLITGDFFSGPRNAVFDLEAELKDVRADLRVIEEKVTCFLKKRDCDFPGINGSDFVDGMARCLEKMDLARFGIPLRLADHVNPVNGTFAGILGNTPRHLLLPYCAKPLDCSWRYEKGCAECGECTVGDAYGIGKDRGMEVITIQSFEHLIEVLGRLRSEGASSYIGCCCEAFFTKHAEDFENAGLPAILIDIDNTNCYDLGKERSAYAGKFESKTELKLDLIWRVLDAKV
ncbi:MAG: lipoate--protein ligase family protein [Euryarchaeota archaeon]|nr:lipoate--protein ligase family protein [Euryarchaeota archaeon]